MKAEIWNKGGGGWALGLSGIAVVFVPAAQEPKPAGYPEGAYRFGPVDNGGFSSGQQNSGPRQLTTGRSKLWDNVPTGKERATPPSKEPRR